MMAFDDNMIVWINLSLWCTSKVSQDVPKYTMVSGERAELRGLNLEGLRRRGFSVDEVGFWSVYHACFCITI